MAQGDPWAVDKAGLSARDHADRRGFWEIVAELDRGEALLLLLLLGVGRPPVVRRQDLMHSYCPVHMFCPRPATEASGKQSSYRCSEQLPYPRSPMEKGESSEPAANRTLVFGDGEPECLDENVQGASDRAARRPLTLGELGAAAPSTTAASSPCCSTTASSAATRIFEDATPLVNFSGDALLSFGEELRVEKPKH